MSNTKNNKPLVSVIVTTFNRADLIGETIESILNQTYTNFELIIVDDGSTDNTEGVVKKYNDKKIQYIKTGNWGGPAHPRNIGIKKAKGEYIAFCDDDDLWYPQKLEKQIQFLSNNDIIGVGSNTESIGDTTYFHNRNGKVAKKTKILDFQDIIKGQNVPLSSLVVVNSEVRYSEDEDLIYVEDWDYQIRLTINGKKIALLPEVLVKYRRFSVNKDYPKKSANIIYVLNKYRYQYSSDEYSHQLCKYYRYMGLRYLKSGDKTNAILNLKKASSTCDGKQFWYVFMMSVLPIRLIRFALSIYYLN